MHKGGHLGTSLLVYAPVMAVLVALDHTTAAIAGLAVACSMAMFPDIDQRIPRLTHRGPITHSLWTVIGVGVATAGLARTPYGFGAILAVGMFTGMHRFLPVSLSLSVFDSRLLEIVKLQKALNTAVQLAIGLVAGMLVWTAINPSTVSMPHFAVFIGAIAATTVASHLLADIITPAGLTPFAPVSRKKYSLGIVKAGNSLGNYVLLGIGLVAVSGAALYAGQLPL